MNTPDVTTTTTGITLTTARAPRRLLWCTAPLGFLAAASLVAVLTAVQVHRAATSRLSADTRMVVRFPRALFAELTQDEIREEFPILEQSGEMQVTGAAVATGKVSVEIEPDLECPSREHAVIAVHVVGETEKSLVGSQSNVRILGTGHGRFDAVKRIHFDGRTFRTDDTTTVDATHETQIDDVETPVGGPFRLLASRKAREAVPIVDRVAIERIKQRVAQRVDELVSAALKRWNLLDHLDQAIARLHPALDDWRVEVTANDESIQAALIPAGGALPDLPTASGSDVEVWMRLTPAQRLGVNLLNLGDQSYRLLGGVLPAEQAQQLGHAMSVADVEDWTCLRVASSGLRPAS